MKNAYAGFKLSLWAVALGCLVLQSPTHAQVPQIINHQGRVTVNGVNFDGQGLRI